MKALQYRTIGSAPEVVDIPTPEPGPGQVLLKVTAAGVCHSDEFVMSLPAEAYVYGLPLTLGHEGAGVVAADLCHGSRELLRERRPAGDHAARAGLAGGDGRVSARRQPPTPRPAR